MKIDVVTKKLRVTKYDLVRAQILMKLVFEQKQYINESDIAILTLLAIRGPVKLSHFCEYASEFVYKDGKLSSRTQNIRNRLNFMEKQGFILREGDGRRMVKIKDTVVCQSNTMLDYKILYVETN